MTEDSTMSNNQDLETMRLEDLRRIAKDTGADPERRKKANDWWIIRTRCFDE